MNKRLLTVCAALLLCGCDTAVSEPAKNPADLADWQRDILEAQGLPTDYNALTYKQQQSITRIGVMTDWLTEKYDEEFVYVQYIPPELMQSEELIVYPAKLGSGDGKYLITVKAADGGFQDNYMDFSVLDLAAEMLDDFLSAHFAKEDYIYDWTPLACDLTLADLDADAIDFEWKCGAQNTIYVLESAMNMAEIEDFAVEYAQFLHTYHLSGSHRIEVLSEFTPLTSGRHTDWLMSDADRGYYLISLSSMHDKVLVSMYEQDGNRRSGVDDLGYRDGFPYEDYISGALRLEPLPNAIYDITYQGEVVLDQMFVDRPTRTVSLETIHALHAGSPKNLLYFPQLSGLLKAAGWEFDTNGKDSVSWRKGDRTVCYRITREEVTDQQGQIYELPYRLRTHLYLNDTEYTAEMLGSDTVGMGFIQSDTMPTMDKTDFLAYIEMDQHLLQTLFGIVIEPDFDNATGAVTAIDSYEG